jgi:hypothetical protein
MVRFALLTVAWLIVTASAFAHGNTQHVLGTVAAIDAKHIEVKTNKGTTVSVGLTKQTRYIEKGNPKSILPPSIGDRVVIEAIREEKDSKGLTATEVHYSANKQAPAVPAQ